MSTPPAPGAAPPEGATGTPTPPAPSLRQQALRFGLAVALTIALLTPPILVADRPASSPQLTIIGSGRENDSSLSLLLEGAGGGRVLIGGGASGADLPAALARTAPPWRDRLDLLLVTDLRDLPGAAELVRRGRVGQVATVSLANERADALVALRERCAASGVPLRAIVAGERIAVGRGNMLTIDVRPGTDGVATTIALTWDGLSAAIMAGADTPAGAPAVAIVPHGTVDTYHTALATGPRLLVAPASPTVGDPATATQLLVVAPGQRVTLSAAGANLRLRGGTPTALLGDTAR